MKKKLLLVIVSLFIGLSLIIAFVPQARMMAYVIYYNGIKSSTEFEVDGKELYMNGYICSKTYEQIKEVIEQNPQVETIVMQEVTGSLDDETNFVMAKWVHEKGLNTYLTKDSDIESGGTDFFLAGKKRTMENGAKIGIHSWRDAGTNKEAKDIPKDSIEHENNKKYIEEMLGKDDFYWYTIYAAPADGMYFMTNEEILEYGLVTEPIID